MANGFFNNKRSIEPSGVEKVALSKTTSTVFVSFEMKSGDKETRSFGTTDQGGAEACFKWNVFPLLDHISGVYEPTNKFSGFRSWLDKKLSSGEWGDLVLISIEYVENQWKYKIELRQTESHGVLAKERAVESRRELAASKHEDFPDDIRIGTGEASLASREHGARVSGLLAELAKDLGELSADFNQLSNRVDSFESVQEGVIARAEDLRRDFDGIRDDLDHARDNDKGGSGGERSVEVRDRAGVEEIEKLRSFVSDSTGGVSEKLTTINEKLDSFNGWRNSILGRVRKLERSSGPSRRVENGMAEIRDSLGGVNVQITDFASRLSEFDKIQKKLERNFSALKRTLAEPGDDPLVDDIRRELGPLEERCGALAERLQQRHEVFSKASRLVDDLKQAIGREVKDASVLHEALKRLEDLGSRLKKVESYRSTGESSPFRDMALALKMRDLLERSEDEVKRSLDQAMLADSVRYVLRFVDLAVSENDDGSSIYDAAVAKPAERLLELAGLSQILPKPGERLQVRLHEMAAEERSRYDRGCIASVRQRGFVKDGKVLFKAQVVVSMGR